MSPPATLGIDARGHRIPSLGHRIVVGALRFIPLVIVLVGLPVAVLTDLAARGIAPPVPILTATAAGISIAILSTAAYIGKPTRAYGPLTIATSSVAVVYLLALLARPSLRIAIPGTAVALSIGYAHLLELLLIVPALGLLAGIVTLMEDLRSRGERLRYDFPP